jgi:hypothetical protein
MPEISSEQSITEINELVRCARELSTSDKPPLKAAAAQFLEAGRGYTTALDRVVSAQAGADAIGVRIAAGRARVASATLERGALLDELAADEIRAPVEAADPRLTKIATVATLLTVLEAALERLEIDRREARISVIVAEHEAQRCLAELMRKCAALTYLRTVDLGAELLQFDPNAMPSFDSSTRAGRFQDAYDNIIGLWRTGEAAMSVRINRLREFGYE